MVSFSIITITSGTITATGGSTGAGIGDGYMNGACGTITSGVTKVTATKGGDGAQSIGKGYEGEDITKNIDPTANVTQN